MSLLQRSLTFLSAKKGGVTNITLNPLDPLCAFVSISVPVDKAKTLQTRVVYVKAACKTSGDFSKR